MPENVRQAEIDTRNGKVIRELNTAEADSVKAQQSAVKNANSKTNIAEPSAPPKEIYLTSIPPEFLRVEYFVGGTVPIRAMIPTDETDLDPNANPEATATPFTTWQESQEINKGNSNSAKPPNELEKNGVQKNLTLMICPTSGLRATIYCPIKNPETFVPGSEPKELCPFHTKPPN